MQAGGVFKEIKEVNWGILGAHPPILGLEKQLCGQSD